VADASVPKRFLFEIVRRPLLPRFRRISKMSYNSCGFGKTFLKHLIMDLLNLVRDLLWTALVFVPSEQRRAHPEFAIQSLVWLRF
jgi:hypothetical protein